MTYSIKINKKDNTINIIGKCKELYIKIKIYLTRRGGGML